MPDSAVLAWSWNAKRQAINPSDAADSAIEYLTPKGERRTLAYADLVDTVYRAPMRPREGAAREAFDRKGRTHYLRLSASDSLCVWNPSNAGIRKRPCAGCLAHLSAMYYAASMR